MIKRKKREITLIEIMIVITIIAMITGVLAYNYSGSLEETKYSKTKIGIEKLETILSLAHAEYPDIDIETQWKEIIKKSPLVSDADALVKDGWGKEYQVELEDDGQIHIVSEMYQNYKR